MTIWVNQATQGEVEAVDPEKVVEEEEDGTKRRIPTQIRKIPPTKVLIYIIAEHSRCQGVFI